MTIQDLIKKLQDATDQQFWKKPPEKVTFKDVLVQYGIYYQELSSSQSRIELANFFWELIEAIGTPIIEGTSTEKCEVYFLFPKDNLKNSHDLYLQGEFHGYGGISERNKLEELANTGIMYRADSIPINAIIAYQYQQKDGLILNDNNSSHRNVYHGYAGQVIFRVNPIPEKSRLGEKEEDNYWDRILFSDSTHSNKHFYYQATYYSDSSNKLHTCNDPLPKKVDIYNPVPANLDEIEGEDLSASPYANFTHAVHIFKPTSGNIENVIIFNDGRPYILAGIMDQLERMVNKDTLSANTAFVFIDALQGLAKTMPDIVKDERFKMSGMGVRIIAFDKGIDNYIIFLEHLFQQLSKNDSSIPNDPSNRIMVGASLSGTACIHIAFEAPKLFHGLIAQSPSPSNDQILMDVKTHQAANIHLSCGFFEQSSFNGTDTDCFKYANILSEKIDLKFNKQDFHGHNHVAWIFDLDQSLPIILQKKSLDDGLSQALSYATITKALTSNKLIALPDAEQERKVVLSEDKIINRTKPTPSLVLSSENDELDNSSQESSSYKI